MSGALVEGLRSLAEIDGLRSLAGGASSVVAIVGGEEDDVEEFSIRYVQVDMGIRAEDKGRR